MNDSRQQNPRHLDVSKLAREQGKMQGQCALSTLSRLMDGETSIPAAADSQSVQWQAEGEWRQPMGQPPQVWLHLVASTQVHRECQRCLAPVPLRLAVDRWFRFVADAALAERLDAESDEDVLDLEPRFDLLTLIEDELLLALPIIARHDDCHQIVHSATFEDQAAASEGGATRDNPFAVLARLKRGSDAGSH